MQTSESASMLPYYIILLIFPILTVETNYAVCLYAQEKESFGTTTEEMVWDRKRLCALISNTIIPLLIMKTRPFNADKESFDLLCSTASTKISASSLSISSKPHTLCAAVKEFPDDYCQIPNSSDRDVSTDFLLKAHSGDLISVPSNPKFYFH
jgi:hypothetical protein